MLSVTPRGFAAVSVQPRAIMKRLKQATLFDHLGRVGEAGPSVIRVRVCQVSESQPLLVGGDLREPCCEHEEPPIPPMIEHSLLEVAITRSRPLADTEIYTLLTTAQDNITDEELETRSFTFGGGQ